MCSLDARVLFDPGASHSFVSPVFASRMEWQPSKILFPLSVATPLSDELETDVFFPSCPVLVEGRELLADLVGCDRLRCDLRDGLVGSTLCFVRLSRGSGNFPNP